VCFSLVCCVLLGIYIHDSKPVGRAVAKAPEPQSRKYSPLIDSHEQTKNARRFATPSLEFCTF